MTLEVWAFVLIVVFCVIVGLVAGFFGARALMMSMGRKPSEAQIRQVMNNMKKNQ